jgi:uncharacterized protein (DUF362 family)
MKAVALPKNHVAGGVSMEVAQGQGRGLSLDLDHSLRQARPDRCQSTAGRALAAYCQKHQAIGGEPSVADTESTSC